MSKGYKVLSVSAGCCGDIPKQEIEKVSTKMQGEGYELVEAYLDIQGCCGGCCCQNKCVILIFKG